MFLLTTSEELECSEDHTNISRDHHSHDTSDHREENLFVSQNQKYEFSECGVTNCLHIVSYHHVMNYMLTCSLTRDRGVYNDLIRLGAPSEVSVSHLNCVIVPSLIHWRYQPATSRLSKYRVLVQLLEKQQQIFVT